MLAAGSARGYELAGKVVFEDEPRLRAGARVILLARRDTAYTDSQGQFRFRDPIGIARPPRFGAKPGLRARVRAGFLEYTAADRSEARLEAFGPDGRRWAAWRHRPSAPGPQRVGLGPMGKGGRGLGWLRLVTRAGTVRLRILLTGQGPGAGALEAGPIEGRPAEAKTIGEEAIEARAMEAGDGVNPANRGVAKRMVDSGAGDWQPEQPVDSLRIEKEGYYPARLYVLPSPPAEGYFAYLYKNSIYGLPPPEVAAWKDFLLRPAVTISVSADRIILPKERIGGYVVTADGKLWTDWSANRCDPYSLPVKLVLDYFRQGLEYRDTLDLAALRRFTESFRVDTEAVDSSLRRYRMSWDWALRPASETPERDWMALSLDRTLASDIDFSYPDVFQVGVVTGIEGGRTLYGRIDPRAGSWIMNGYQGQRAGLRASFTLARRDDHDLRLILGATAPAVPFPEAYRLSGDWPAGGVLRTRQSIRISATGVPARKAADLLLLAPPGRNITLKEKWDGSPLEWAFPYPVGDTVAFRLLARDEGWLDCGGSDTSPELRIAPLPGDSAVTAFEPNESELDAAPVTDGVWIEAAWPFRPDGIVDKDFYRFRAEGPQNVRISLRNPNDTAIYVSIPASPTAWSLTPASGEERSRNYAIPASGELVFQVIPYGPGGRYSFRIDRLP